MSYASSVKEELCSITQDNSNAKLAELEAMLRFGAEINFSSEGLKIAFSNNTLMVIRHFLTLLKQFFTCDTELAQRQIKQFYSHNSYTLYINSQADVICNEFELLGDNQDVHAEILNDKDRAIAFLRGAFLCKGSVNDPKTSNYHLEIIATSESEALFTQRLMNLFDLNARISKRRDSLIVYIKNVEMISDFLRILGTQQAVFAMENTIIQRGISSNITRIMNCEIANEAKTMLAAKDQLKYIRYIEYNYPLEKLDEKLLLIMKVRKENPEASLNEMLVILEEKYGEQLTKSGLNHRLRKLKEIAINYQEKKRNR